MYKEYSKEFIQQLIEKVDLVEYISQYVELKKKGKYYFGICPFHTENTGSFCVSESKQTWVCYGCNLSGNIISFIIEYHKLSYPEAVEYLSNHTGLEQGEIKPIPETIKFLRKFNKKKTEIIQHKILPNNIMEQYSHEPILEWLWEGISQEIMDEYQVRYDSRSNRAVFPIWNNDGDIINIKGRSLYENFKELGIKKYIYYHELGCNDFLYPLHLKKEIIKEMGEALIWEGSKNVWKCDTWNILNSLSLETSNINDFQIKQLLELKTNLVFCMDKGVDMGKLCNKISVLTKFTNVYLLLDNKELLEEKDAPCDKGEEIFWELYKNKIKL